MNEKQRLQRIIDENIELAEEGHIPSQQAIINAQADLDRIAQSETEALDFLISCTPISPRKGVFFYAQFYCPIVGSCNKIKVISWHATCMNYLVSH